VLSRPRWPRVSSDIRATIADQIEALKTAIKESQSNSNVLSELAARSSGDVANTLQTRMMAALDEFKAALEHAIPERLTFAGAAALGGDGSASLSVLKGLPVSATSEIGRAALALLVAAVAWFGGCASAAEPLGRLPADPGQVSVSGISSGAFMANQLHIAHSAGIMGAGIIAGGLYGCAVDSVISDGVFSLASLAVGPCMSVPTLLKPVESYAKVVAELAAQGWIDPPSNLARSHVYMFTGQADQVVNFKTVELGRNLYRTLGVPESQIIFRYHDLPAPGAGHSWVTKNFGNKCAANYLPFINRCTYDQAEDMLSTIYGPLQPPNIPPSGRIVSFDQTEFVPGNAPEANGMSDTGYLLHPTGVRARGREALPPTRRTAWLPAIGGGAG
jgi:hypothetical protein